MSRTDGSLSYVAALPAVVADDGDIIITRKFLDGMALYSALWDGKVRALLKAAPHQANHLDNVRVKPANLPFELRVLRADQPWEDGIDNEGLVMCSLGFDVLHLPDQLRSRQIPVLFVTELTVRTRLQIVRNSGQLGPLKQARKLAWEAYQEHLNRKALARAAGAQCNGTPTFRAYQAVSPDALLYFDSRSTADMLASDQSLETRFAEAARGKTLRLAFSGRLVPIKGVEQLVPLAARLREKGVDFSLSIYGAGECEGGMRKAIQEQQLGDHVKLEGSLDFISELTPRIRDKTDLFVCCHPQGDPSCTYLETMACGVPVVGYANEALAGLLEHVDAGRATPMDDVQCLANAIASVAQDRDMLERWSRNALDFARLHTFEKGFERRVAHAQRLGRRPR